MKSYNETVGSLDNRVLPGVRRFKELGAGSGDEIESLEQIDTLPRALRSSDLADQSTAAVGIAALAS